MNDGKAEKKLHKEISLSDTDNELRLAHNKFQFFEEISMARERIDSFRNLLSKLNDPSYVANNPEENQLTGAMSRREVFWQVFEQRMDQKHKSEWKEFLTTLKLNHLISDDENNNRDSGDIVREVFLNLLNYFHSLLSATDMLLINSINVEHIPYLFELSNKKTVLNEIAKESSILKWRKKDVFNFVESSSVIKWGLEDKRKSKLQKVLSFKDANANLNIDFLNQLHHIFSDILEENKSYSEEFKLNLKHKIISNKNLGQLTSDESMILDEVFSSVYE